MDMKKPGKSKIAVVVHGGCGAVASAAERRKRNAICQGAAEAAYRVLREGGSSLDAVERAVCVCEDSGILNAGRGGFLQADGVRRSDCSIMADDRRAGSVVQVPLLRNPIRLARYILEQRAHVMLSGTQALELALRLGHEIHAGAAPGKIEYWQEHMNEAVRALDYAKMATQWRESQRHRVGTVGAVALDARGHIAAATSTGGLGQCYPGRVGDSAVIGAGTYATGRVGVSMTGAGEHILVQLSARTLCDRVGEGMLLDGAAGSVIEDLGKAGAFAGLIALDRSGEIVAVKNTEFMAVGRCA